jgi:hypothetical protein
VENYQQIQEGCMRFVKLSQVVLVCGFLAILAPSLCSGQAFIINFDNDPNGNAIATGSKLGLTYAGMGLTFTHVGTTSGNCNSVFATSEGRMGFGSAPNVITLCPAGIAADINENVFGLIRVISEYDLTSFCIEVGAVTGSSHAVMRGYDAGGNLVDEQTSTPGVNETLCVSGRRLRSAEFSGASSTYTWFDNLAVTGMGLGPIFYYLPGAANVNGFKGSRWRTDLEVYNPNSWDVVVRVENLVRDQANPSPAFFTFNLAAGESRRFTKVVGNMFSHTGASTLRVSANFGSLITTSRTYNDAAIGTYGQFTPGKTIADAVGPGNTGRLIQLAQSMSETTGDRTNIGIANLGDFNIDTHVELYRSNGTLMTTISDTLLPYESTHYDKVFLPHISSDLTDAYAIVYSDTPEAVFLAFATPVDNRTGDPFYFPAMVWW